MAASRPRAAKVGIRLDTWEAISERPASDQVGPYSASTLYEVVEVTSLIQMAVVQKVTKKLNTSNRG